ncbi:hypothetical protein QTP88_020729 [Uroleucon formosanum]
MNARQNGPHFEIHFQGSCVNKKNCHLGPEHHQEKENDNLENDSFVEEPIVPDAEQNLETVEQEVISQTIVDEDAENEKSSNELLWTSPQPSLFANKERRGV